MKFVKFGPMKKWNIKFELNIVVPWLATLFYRWVCRSSDALA